MIQLSIFLFTFHYMVFGKLYDTGNLNYHHPKHVQFPTLQFQTRHYSLEHIQCSCEFHFRERVRLKNKGRQFFYFCPQLNFLEQGKTILLLQRKGEIEECITNKKNHYQLNKAYLMVVIQCSVPLFHPANSTFDPIIVHVTIGP